MRLRGRALISRTVLALLLVGLLELPVAASTPPETAPSGQAQTGTYARERERGTASTGSTEAGVLPPGVSFISEEPCPNDSIFTCITLRVPRDWFSASPETFDVVFALHRATGNRKGTWVTVNGGPGLAGIACCADSYTPYFDPRLVRRYDLVFFDKRGVGMSENLACPEAALAFYTSPYVATVSRDEALAYSVDSATFATDCIAETGVDPEDLPYFSTLQSVEDLEAFRAWLGADKLDIYGESYGTQYAQTYAAAHPDRVKSIVLDGAVDLTTPVLRYYSEGARAHELALVGTLDICSTTRACQRDLIGRDALARYDRLAARLEEAPIAYDFVRRDGTVERRHFSFGDLETAAAGYIGGETDRMLFQRAIAWASRGHLLPLARLAYIGLGQDPDTLEAIDVPTWSDAMYYATECMDYAFGTGTAEQRVEHYLRRGEQTGVNDVRVGSIFYGDLPCAHWPVHPPQGRPDYLQDTTFPTFILAGTWDPATPFPNSDRLARNVDNSYLIVQHGGGHVFWGYGVPCVDNPIYRFLLDDKLPTWHRKSCGFTGVDPYVRIPAERRADYAGPLAAMTAIDREINNSADYMNWGGEDPLRYGCLLGGWIRYRPIVDGIRVKLEGCKLSRGMALTGRATIFDDGSFRLAVTGPRGLDLVYRRDADGSRSVTGTWPGG